MLGACAMFIYEMFSMSADGYWHYFSDGWNIFDIFTLPAYGSLCYIKLIPEDETEIPWLNKTERLLECFIVFAIWLKVTWY